MVLLAVSPAALYGHQALTDGALPDRPVLSGHHAVHQCGRHHLERVGAVARQHRHGEVGGTPDLQHLGQRDLLQEEEERRGFYLLHGGISTKSINEHKLFF